MAIRIPAPLRWLMLAAVVPLTLACGSGSSSPASGPIVFAASSLQEALTEAADAWTARGHPAPLLSFAATSTLARQVEQGAPADLFVSADEEWMDTLDKAGLLRPGTRADLLGNRLVLIAARGSGVRSLAELGDGRLALADPEAVPAGRYARGALERLGQWPALAGRLAPTENVRAALVLVERGEAPLGIVYATDARASDKVEVVQTYPEDSHPPIRYPIAILAASHNADAAALRAFLAAPESKRIFARHGFETPK
jgi:molybdate transport system substrate-binding protein